MKKGTKKILIGSSIALAGAAIGAVYNATLRALMKVAIDRETPKGYNKQRARLIRHERLDEIIEKMSAAAKDLENSGCELIEIEGHDGVKLIGHLYLPENPKRFIVAMHGWRSSWCNDFGVIAPFWHKNDCAVLYAEQRGQGESGGEYMGFGLLERYDCFDWIKWVNERTKAKYPIYLGGVSMGATTVLMTSGWELPSNVCGIIADCGFTSPKAIFQHVANNNLKIPYKLYGAAANDICKKKWNLDSDSYSCTMALKDNKVPVLFVHGTDDTFVPISMTYENYKSCTAPKKLFIVPGAQHGMSYIIDKKGYENEVLNFWRKYDK